MQHAAVTKLFHAYAYIGIFMMAAGLGLRYHIAKRRFYRRGTFGNEYFSKFGKMMFTRVVEGLGMGFGVLLIMLGIIFVLAGIM